MMPPHLSFVRYCINEQQCIPTVTDWYALFLFMQQQALLGVGFRGIERMKEAGVDIPRNVLLKWYAIVLQIEDRNKLLNERCLELQHLFAIGGYRCCVLKGQGNALMYPQPLRRQCGDIDIWVEGKIKDVVKHLSTICEIKESNIEYHHGEFHIWNNDVKVEVHWRPSWKSSPLYNARMQKWFKKQAGIQFSNVEKNSGLHVPTWNFNVVYQLQHMYMHFLQEGVGLRQVMDYYYLLMSIESNSLEPKKKELKITLQSLHLWHFAGAVMYVIKEIFDIPIDKMICDPHEKDGRFLLDEILRSGNFGQYDVRNKTLMNQKGMMRKLHQVKRGMRYLRYYPEEVLCSPFRIYHVIWRKLKLWKW